MKYIHRKIEASLHHHISRGKSILLLGPRQTGKSTLLEHVEKDLLISLVLPSTRLRYEKNPSILLGEIKALASRINKKPLIVLDEVQKVPSIMDVIQEIIDSNLATFVLTGSSARKLKRGTNINLLPGRIVTMRLDPFIYNEAHYNTIEEYLLYGALPGIFQVINSDDKGIDLRSYVETYLEEEIRAEALIKQMGPFLRFLELAGLESGNMISFRALSQEIGVSHTTIISYYEILEDCLIAERIDPITKSNTRKKLTKSSRYIFFDLGIRRFCAGEGTKFTPERWGHLFEQYVGLELIRNSRIANNSKIKFWRDANGPEVDFVLEKEGVFIPIEVKWSDKPNIRHAKHIETFLREYKESINGYIICQTPQEIQLTEKITAIPWQKIDTLF